MLLYIHSVFFFQAPDYRHVFGWNHNDVPRMPKAAKSSDGTGSSVPDSQTDSNHVSEPTQNPCYIRWWLSFKYNIIFHMTFTCDFHIYAQHPINCNVACNNLFCNTFKHRSCWLYIFFSNAYENSNYCACLWILRILAFQELLKMYVQSIKDFKSNKIS